MNKILTLVFVLLLCTFGGQAQTVCPDGVSANAGPNSFYCAGGSATLGYAPTASGGHKPYSYLWSPATGLSSTTASNPGTTVTATTTYNLVVTDSLGCTATSSVKITVDAAVHANAGAGGSICPGTSFTLGASPTGSGGTGPLIYVWTPTTALSNPSVANPVATPATATTYSVHVIDSLGCGANASATITLRPVPTAIITSNKGTSLCPGDSLTLTADSGLLGGISFRWSTGQTTQSIMVKTAGSYSVTVTNGAGCSAIYTLAITAGTIPVASITAGVPAGDTVTLSAKNVTGDKYKWSTGAKTRIITVDTTGNYEVTVTNAAGCTATATAVVVIIPCSGSTGTFSPNVNNGRMEAEKQNGSDLGTQAQVPDFQLSVFPNPYNGFFHLKIESASSENISVKIYDVDGNIVEERNNIAYAPDIVFGAGYTSGFYIAKVQQGGITRQSRVIKIE